VSHPTRRLMTADRSLNRRACAAGLPSYGGTGIGILADLRPGSRGRRLAGDGYFGLNGMER